MAKKKPNLSQTLKKIDKKRNQKDEELTFDPQVQVEGIEKRLEKSGVDVEKVKDNRKFYEKALGLPEDQNILFDFFEIMNRPQQALFGAIGAGQEGENAGKGLLEGISGKRKTKFKDILNEAEITEETEGKLGADDVLGFLGDRFIDPMNLIIPGSSALAQFNTAELDDAIKTADAAIDAFEVFKGTADLEYAKLADEVKKNWDMLEEGAKIASSKADILQATKDGLSSRDISIRQLATRGLGKGFKGMFRMADSGITASLGWIDGLDKARALEKGSRFNGLLDIYEGSKMSLTKTFNMAKLLPKGFMQAYRGVRGKQEYVQNQLEGLAKNMVPQMEKNVQRVIASLSEQGIEMSEDRVKGLISIIYEHDVFDLGSENPIVDVGRINSLFRQSNMGDIFNSQDSFMTLGLQDQDKDALETFIKTFMPDWYRKNIEDGEMFIKGTEGEWVTGTWRIKNQGWLNKEDEGSLVSTFNQYKKMSSEEKIKKYLEDNFVGVDTGKIDDINTSEIHRYLMVKTEIERLNERLASGQKTVLSESSGFLKQFLYDKRTLTEAVDEKEKIMEMIETLRHNPRFESIEGKSIEDLWIALEDIELKIQDTKLKGVENIKNFDKDQVEISDIISNLTYEFESLSQSVDKDALKMVESFLSPEATKFDMRSSFNNKTINDLETITDLTFDDVNETVAGIHMYYSKSSKLISDSFKTAYFDEVFTDDYMRHSPTKEWLENNFKAYEDKILNNTKISPTEAARISNLMGNSNTFSGRRWNASVVEANELSKQYLDWLGQVGLADSKSETYLKAKDIEMFATDIKTPMMDFAATGVKTTADSLVYRQMFESIFMVSDEAAAAQGWQKTNLIRTLPQASELGVPKGFVAVESKALLDKSENLLNFFRYSGDSQETITDLRKGMKTWFESAQGKKVFIDKNLDRLIGRMTDKKEQGSFLSFMDSINRVFRKFKLLSPGFPFRSTVGSYSNMWLGGVPSKDIAKYSHKAFKDFSSAQEILARQMQGATLTVDEMVKVSNYNEFMSAGFGFVQNKIDDIDDLAETFSKGTKFKIEGAQDILKAPSKAMDKMAKFNLELNRDITLKQRYSLWLYGKENPQWLKDNGYTDATDAVRQVLYDYLDLSANEQDVMKRIIPFYTFTKKNIGFQLNNMGKNVDRYSDLVKTYNSGWDVLDLSEEEQDTYKKESFWIPIPAIKDGKYTAIKASLPIGSLGDYLNNPIQRTAASTAPLIRAPFEIAMNKQAFSGMAISDFKGQRGYMIPEISRKAEHGLSQLGLDVPVSGALGLGRTLSSALKGETASFSDALQGGLGRSILSQGDAAKTAERKAYDRLDNMRELMNYYKQENVEVMTLAEINNREKFNSTEYRIRQLRAIRNKKRPR